jgi:AcrR family transcriptional regulator
VDGPAPDDAPRRPRGRPIDPATDASIVAAAAMLLRRDGFQRMTVAAVAEAAGVAKTTVYRRYPTIVELAVAGIERLNFTHPGPDTGSARDDLTTLLVQARNWYDLSITGTLLVTERDHPELFAAGRRQMLTPAVNRFRTVLQAGIERGELRAGLDVDTTAHLLLGAFFTHYFELGRPEPEWAATVVEALWPALASPPHLD